MIRQIAGYVDSLVHSSTTKPGYSREIVVVSICGFLGTIGFAFIWFEALEALGDGVGTQMTYGLFAEVIRPVIVVFLLWLWFTIGGHFLAKAFNVRGPMGRLFRASAWAIVPIGIWHLIRSAAIVVLYYFQVEIPESITEFPTLGPDAHVGHLLELGLEDPIYVGIVLLGALFTVWSGHLMARALVEAKDMEVDDARKVAALVVAPYTLYLVYRALVWATLL